MLKTCKNCKYYYRVMATVSGYNPAPTCHRYEEEGKSAQGKGNKKTYSELAPDNIYRRQEKRIFCAW